MGLTKFARHRMNFGQNAEVGEGFSRPNATAEDQIIARRSTTLSHWLEFIEYGHSLQEWTDSDREVVWYLCHNFLNRRPGHRRGYR